MRDIKFRAWDKDKKIFKSDIGILPNGDLYDCFMDHYEERKCFIISQYTGLKDRQGQEVYEGDIVKFKGLFDMGKYENVEIVFDKGEFCIKWRGSICHNLLALNSDSIEVIGNIYENKELLKWIIYKSERTKQGN